MEALELIGAVGRQPHGIAVVGQLPAGVQHLAAEGFGDGAVQPVELPPQDMAHLPEGGRGAEGDGRFAVGVDEPEQGHRGAESLAETVAGLDRHPPSGGQGGNTSSCLSQSCTPSTCRAKATGDSDSGADGPSVSPGSGVHRQRPCSCPCPGIRSS